MTWSSEQTDITDLSYADYLARGGSDIPEASWATYLARARRLVRDITRGRSETIATDETEAAEITRLSEAVNDALCRAADALYSAETGITSERIGSYSYTRGNAATKADAASEVIAALATTGLTYVGLKVVY